MELFDETLGFAPPELVSLLICSSSEKISEESYPGVEAEVETDSNTTKGSSIDEPKFDLDE